MADAPIELRADPDLKKWASLVPFGPIDQASEQFRSELGLPTTGPIVTTGHQPTFWHPGILAKYLAADALADSIGAHAAWLVVDQDAVDPFAIELPIRPKNGALTAHALRLAGEVTDGHSAASVSPARPTAIDDTIPYAIDGIGTRTRAMSAALASHMNESSAARQAVHANFDALERVLPKKPVVFASDLNRTSLFGELLVRMERDPENTVSAYNEAVRMFPDAQLTELASSDIQYLYELPLWSITEGEPRRRVYHHDLESIDRATLVPRALLVTAMMRLAGCELFIHGTGGAVYDQATEHWMKRWLNAKLAPSVAISADLRLGLDSGTVSEQESRHARWLAHSARHNPSLIGNETAQGAKNKLVERIALAIERGENAAPLFRELHDNRRTFEFAHAMELAHLRENATILEQRAIESSVANKRDWPAAIYAAEQLGALEARIRSEFSPGSGVRDASKAINPSRAR